MEENLHEAQHDEHSGEMESKGEEDDLMDDEEYKKMIERRGKKTA